MMLQATLPFAVFASLASRPRRVIRVEDNVPPADVELSNTLAPMALMEEPEKQYSFEITQADLEAMVADRASKVALDLIQTWAMDVPSIIDRRIEAHHERKTQQAYLDSLMAKAKALKTPETPSRPSVPKVQAGAKRGLWARLTGWIFGD